MLDFIEIDETNAKNGITVSPSFIFKRSKDILIKGKSFYAIWDEETGLWSTDDFDVARLVDNEVKKYIKDKYQLADYHITQRRMSTSKSRVLNEYVDWMKKMPDSRAQLNKKIIFKSTDVKKEDFVSFKLDYDLEKGECPSYDEIMQTLYSEEERQKIEWAIGSIIAGDSKTIQKFIVLYGDAGTGKSTVLDIISMLFEGYTESFNAKELGSGTNAFATGYFAKNPLVAIQHDGDLSRLADNTLLNTIVAHENLIVNEKFKSCYTIKPQSFLFMGTNNMVNITDSKSGMKRRVIDVQPTGEKIPQRRFTLLKSKLEFEKGYIAQHCLDVYRELGIHYYDNYEPRIFMKGTNQVYSFLSELYFDFLEFDGMSLRNAYEKYKNWCTESGEQYPLKKRKFREEMSVYFEEFYEQYFEDGKHISNYFKGFKKDEFNTKPNVIDKKPVSLSLDCTKSLLDDELKDYKAQLVTAKETPQDKWENVETCLKDIDTSKIHYVMMPENHIVIDFDLKGDDGNKSFELNAIAASKFPSTYAELSKGGEGIHLHYIYDGDVNELSRIYDDNIEIKVFTGNSSLRRRLTKCNNIPIAHISSGLPLKEKGKYMVNFEGYKSAKKLREAVVEALEKGKPHYATKPNMDFIKMITDQAYENGIKYDLTNLRESLIIFARHSSHQSDYCLKLIPKLHLKSEDEFEGGQYKTDKIVFYDVEVFPNLFLVNYKFAGEENKVVRLINPTPEQIEELSHYKLVGFNCRRYDNHIMYARMMGYTNEKLYYLSQRIIQGFTDAFFGDAYSFSYTDIYDYAAKKQSLKKWEIELGIHHQELGLPWDKPVPEDKWELVAEYCDNDVIATEAVWNATQGDFVAREILADVAGMTVNDTTNTLTTRFIFGKNKNPQSEFNYRFMGEPEINQKCEGIGDGITVFQENGKPIFMDYKFDYGKSTYMGFDVGEGGFVYAQPGMYRNVVTFDVASMHPSSVIAEELFGPEYTKRFQEILQTRIYIKHKEFDKAKTMLGGALAKYLDDESKAKALAQALKIAINSVYGLTAAKFPNPFRDERNIDNIVAKRGALFMINLKTLVEKMGGTVIHIKTDSIKVENPSDEIVEFIMSYGKRFGYNFEVEHKFEKICLVNNAVYIAKLAEDDPEDPGKWTATGAQFAVPYVFKTLFSKEQIIFDDLCETKSATSDIYLDMNEDLDDSTVYEEVKKYRQKFPDWNLFGTEVTKRAKQILKDYESISDEELEMKIAECHNYNFVGKVGRFCPIKEGCGGGILYRCKDDKYFTITGSKGYRWKEAESVKNEHLEKDIDKSYYQKLVDEAIESISKFCDIETFID